MRVSSANAGASIKTGPLSADTPGLNNSVERRSDDDCGEFRALPAAVADDCREIPGGRTRDTWLELALE